MKPEIELHIARRKRSWPSAIRRGVRCYVCAEESGPFAYVESFRLRGLTEEVVFRVCEKCAPRVVMSKVRNLFCSKL
jgi:hypothetical protein